MFTCATQKHKKIYIVQETLNQWKDWEFYWKKRTSARRNALLRMAINGRYTRRKRKRKSSFHWRSALPHIKIISSSYLCPVDLHKLLNGLWQQKIMLPQTCCLGSSGYLWVMSCGMLWQHGSRDTRHGNLHECSFSIGSVVVGGNP